MFKFDPLTSMQGSNPQSVTFEAFKSQAFFKIIDSIQRPGQAGIVITSVLFVGTFEYV